MSGEDFNPERQLADILQQAGQVSRMMLAHSQETASGPPRHLYERVEWENVSAMAAEGWELTAVISDGKHVMQRQFTVADAAAELIKPSNGA